MKSDRNEIALESEEVAKVNNLDKVSELREQGWSSRLLDLLECRWRSEIDYEETLNKLSYLKPELRLFALVITVYNPNFNFCALLGVYRKLGLVEAANRIMADTYRLEKCAAGISIRDGKKLFDRLQYIGVYKDTLKCDYFELNVDYKNAMIVMKCNTPGSLGIHINYIRFTDKLIEVGNSYDGSQSFYILEIDDMGLRRATVEDLDEIEKSIYVCVDLPRFTGYSDIFIL